MKLIFILTERIHMQRKLAALLICLSPLLLMSCSNHLTQSKIAAIEKDVLDVHTQLVAAAENRNADAMFEYILDSDETIIQTGDIAQTRQQALESVRSSFQGFAKIQYEFEQKQITVLSPTRAEMATRGRSVDTTKDGRVLTFPFTQKTLFVLTDDGWKIQSAHHVTETD